MAMPAISRNGIWLIAWPSKKQSRLLGVGCGRAVAQGRQVVGPNQNTRMPVTDIQHFCSTGFNPCRAARHGLKTRATKEILRLPLGWTLGLWRFGRASAAAYC